MFFFQKFQKKFRKKFNFEWIIEILRQLWITLRRRSIFFIKKKKNILRQSEITKACFI
jgi:hypothetical protein